MKREILFRAKRLNDNKWIEGYYAKAENEYLVSFGKHGLKWEMVDPATFGQYTGLTDKNGTRVFEGDIVLTMDDSIATIQYDEEDTMYYLNDDNVLENFGIVSPKWVEVIGNIHDDSEQLEGGAEE